MNSISKLLSVNIPPQQAFKKFVNELNNWWPSDYTWSQDKLEEISYGGQVRRTLYRDWTIRLSY